MSFENGLTSMRSHVNTVLSEITSAEDLQNAVRDRYYKFAIFLILVGIGGLALSGVGFGQVLGSVGSITAIVLGLALGLISFCISIVLWNKRPPPGEERLSLNHSGPSLPAFFLRTQGYPDAILNPYSIRGNNYFDPAKWGICIGSVPDALPPQSLLNYLEDPCPFAQREGVKIKDTHMVIYIPPRVNDWQLTAREFCNHQQQFQRNPLLPPLVEGIPRIEGLYGRYNGFDTSPLERPYWIVMTRHIIPNSTHSTMEEKRDLISQYPNYEVPRLIEVLVGIKGEQLYSGARIFGRLGANCYASEANQLLSFTPSCCEEQFNGEQFFVGGIGGSSGSLHIGCSNNETRYGVAAVRRFEND